MEEFTNEGLDTSLADEAIAQPAQPKPERIKHSVRLEDCLQILDKPEGTRTNEEIDRFAKTLVALGIFDRSSFGNLEPIGFLKKMMPYIRHEVFAPGSALLHINHPQEKASVLVRGKAKEFVPRNAREIETESKNSLSNIKIDKKVCKTFNELSEPENKQLKQRTPSQPISLTSIVEENEHDTSSPAKKRRFGRPNKLKSSKTNNNFTSLNSLERPVSMKQEELLPEFKGSWKSSSKSNSGSIAGTLNNLDEEDENEEFMEEFRKYPKNYFVGEVLKVKLSKILSPGSYFGTKSFERIVNAKQAILAEEECHCITLHRDDYLATLEAEKTLHNDKIEFFLNLFPSFNQEAVTEFSLLWDDQHHKRGDIVYQENDEPKRLFIVFNGEITISKEITDPLAARRYSDGMGLSKKKNLSPLQVATFCQGYFFGEEFFEKKPRVFTATVSSSKARILHLSRRDYRAIAKRYSEIFEKIKQMVRLSSKVNSQRLENLLQVHDLDFNRESMQEAFLSQKEYVLKSERPSRKTHTKTMSMIMKPTKKPKNINVRLQYDKYFVCKPRQKYPEYLKMVVEGNIKPDPTEKTHQLDPRRLGANVPDQQRRLSTPVLRESENLDADLNFTSRQGPGHKKTTSLYKMTQLPISKDDDSSKYNLSAPQTFRVSANNSALQSERTARDYNAAQTGRTSVANENKYALSYDDEPLIATSTMVPLRLTELDPNQRMENGMIYSEKKFSKAMKGGSMKYTQREMSQINDYTPMLIKTARDAGPGVIVKVPGKVPVNAKLLSGQRDGGYGGVKSLNNLPSTILPQIKFDIKEKLKGSENSTMMFMRSPRKKDYGSLNDLNEALGQERRSLANVEINSLKKF